MSYLAYVAAAVVVYIAVTVALYALANAMPVLGFYGRMLASWGSLILCAAYGTVASIALRLVGRAGLSQWTTARSFKWVMWLTTGIGFELEGSEHLATRPCVFVGNHQTSLDVLLLGYIFPPYCSVTAKKSLRWVPFLGWFMALSNTVFIDRGNRKAAGAALDGAARKMKAEQLSVFMFPEGTRSHSTTPDLLPFKKGAFHLAVQAQVPIVPIVCANYSDLLHPPSKTFTAGNIPVKILPPISTKGMTAADVDQLTATTRDRMLEELTRITHVARSKGIAMPAQQAVKAGGRAAGKATGVEVTGGAKTRPGI